MIHFVQKWVGVFLVLISKKLVKTGSALDESTCNTLDRKVYVQFTCLFNCSTRSRAFFVSHFVPEWVDVFLELINKVLVKTRSALDEITCNTLIINSKFSAPFV